MNNLVVAGAAVNQTALDWTGNISRIASAISKAQSLGARLVCFPELALSGYGCADAFRLPMVHAAARRMLERLLPLTKDIVAIVGLPWLFEDRLYNAAAVLVDGLVAGIVFKGRLYHDALREEDRWFTGWPSGRRAEVNLNGQTVPVGDVLFEWNGIRLAVAIGEDLWAGTSRRANVDLVLNPVAEPLCLGEVRRRQERLASLCRQFRCHCVSVNLLGNDAGRIVYDGSVLFGLADGNVIAGPRLSFKPVQLSAIPLPDFPHAEVSSTSSAANSSGQQGEAIPVNIGLKFVSGSPPALPPCTPAPWEESPHLVEEEFCRAIALGLFDYMRKIQARGFVVSLSGGADSSSICCLIAIAIRLAWEELGRKEFLNTLSYFPELASCSTVGELIPRLLRCVYQPSRNSSEASRRSAQAVAAELGVPLAEVSIDPMVQLYVEAAEKVLGRPLSWQTDDVALQNIQSRVRGPLAWLLANAENKVLIATGNRSEAVVGYATMDGDTCGGLTPLGSASKAFLRKWLTWLEKEGPVGIGPIPAVRYPNSLAPSAELRPPEAGQTDEGDVMPYAVLEAIEESILRDCASPARAEEEVARRFPEFSREQIQAWIRKFLRLWSLSQWKRERLAPALFVGPPGGDGWILCHLPILSAGLLESAALTESENTPTP